jgi:hypothetical protein
MQAWTGRVLSALVVAFLLFDGIIKLVALAVLGALLLRDQRLRTLLMPPSRVRQ